MQLLAKAVSSTVSTPRVRSFKRSFEERAWRTRHGGLSGEDSLRANHLTPSRALAGALEAVHCVSNCALREVIIHPILQHRCSCSASRLHEGVHPSNPTDRPQTGPPSAVPEGLEPTSALTHTSQSLHLAASHDLNWPGDGGTAMQLESCSREQTHNTAYWPGHAPPRNRT